MSLDPGHRYTDREVALVLKRAVELEERRQGDARGRGLTLQQLQDIAREVGLDPQVVHDAVAELQRAGPLQPGSIMGSAVATKVVRAVPGDLSKDTLQRLVQLAEDRVTATGTVTEALGVVRWTSVSGGHRFHNTTQIAFTPGADESQIQVTHRYTPRVRTILQLLPGAWAGMIGFAVVSSLGLAVFPAVGIVAGTTVAGAALGRGVWNWLAKRATTRVDDLANELAAEAANRSDRKASSA